MKLKSLLFGVIMSIFMFFNQSANAYSENGSGPDDSMSNFIDDNLDIIKTLIKKHKNVDAQYINDDLAIIIYDFYSIPHVKEKVRKPSFLILFSISEKNDIKSDASQITKEFLNGKIDNIKEIFWYNQGNPYSWSEEAGKLKYEEKCVCGCNTGVFSNRLCLESECSLVDKQKKNKSI